MAQTAGIQTARILTMIVCPVCHAALAMDGAGVRCTGCGVAYPIDDGILVLTPQPSKVEQRISLASDSSRDDA